MQRIRRNGAARVAANRARVDEYLLTHPCVDCGMTDLVVLEFDHVRGVKVAAVSALVTGGYPWTKIDAEIAKCDVRCANCHRRVTVERRKSRSNLAEEPSTYAFRDPGAIRTRDRHLRRVLL
jgi:uncharacterized protein YcfJ